MSDPEKPEVPAKPKRDPAALSPEYHKAHKQVMLWAAILFIWELVGVDLSKAEKAGGNVGPIVTALKSPQAVPWVLLILVGYFLFKCSVEWAQCYPERRKFRFARIDFISAWVVSLAAIVLYIWQTISRSQIANVVSSSRGPSIITSMMAGFSLCAAILTSIRHRENMDRILLAVVGGLTGLALLATVGFFFSGRYWTSGIPGFLVGASLLFLVSPTGVDFYRILWQRAKLRLPKK